jgi:hypothetical protein
MKALQVIDQAFRTTTEEQDDTILWLTQSMRGAGGHLTVLLSGHGVYYATQQQTQPILKVAGWAQTQPANLPRDLSNLLESGVPIYAVTEEKTRVLLIPVDKLKLWVNKYPELNALLYSQYNVRYHDLMDTIHLVLFNKMDQRLYSYLTEKVKLHNKRVIKISHKQIASELGTAREVISRVMKKLETEGLIKREGNSIKVLGL